MAVTNKQHQTWIDRFTPEWFVWASFASTPDGPEVVAATHWMGDAIRCAKDLAKGETGRDAVTYYVTNRAGEVEAIYPTQNGKVQ